MRKGDMSIGLVTFPIEKSGVVPGSVTKVL